MEAAPRLLILGVGNVLLKDEGVGVHAVRELKKRNYPPEVSIVDGGTAGLDLLYLVEDASRLIIIDATNGDAEPGAIFRFSPEELDDYVPSVSSSLHQIGLLEVLHLGRAMGVLPPTVIFGVQPAVIDWGMELSQEVSRRLPQLVSLVEEEVNNWLSQTGN
ncbi:MAG TPA: hydrogenase maturation protease [Desulfotomaculum sp.]|nr:hydrogenase maturation protease [Desulfotomaculum sp.]